MDECNLYFTSFCGGVVCRICDSLNLVVSMAGGSTEVRDLGADGNNRTLLVIVSPRDASNEAKLPTREALQYIYSTNIGTEYFKHGIYSTFFFLKNAVCFIILTYLVPILFTF